MSFKNNIRYLREHRGLTQEELAKRLCMTQATISHYENGETTPHPAIVRQIAKFFKVKQDELMK